MPDITIIDNRAKQFFAGQDNWNTEICRNRDVKHLKVFTTSKFELLSLEDLEPNAHIDIFLSNSRICKRLQEMTMSRNSAMQKCSANFIFAGKDILSIKSNKEGIKWKCLGSSPNASKALFENEE